MLHVAHKSFQQIERSFAYSLIVEEFNMGTKSDMYESVKPINLAEMGDSHLFAAYALWKFHT